MRSRRDCLKVVLESIDAYFLMVTCFERKKKIGAKRRTRTEMLFTSVRLLPARSPVNTSSSTTVVTRLESLPQASESNFSLWDSRVSTSSAQNADIVRRLNEKWEAVHRTGARNSTFLIIDAGWWLTDEGASLRSRTMSEGGNDALSWYLCGSSEQAGLFGALVEWMRKRQSCDSVSIAVSSLFNNPSLDDDGVIVDDLLYPLTTVEQLTPGKLQKHVVSSGVALGRFLNETVFPSFPFMKIRPTSGPQRLGVESPSPPASFCFDFSASSSASSLGVRVLISAERHFGAITARLATVLHCSSPTPSVSHQTQTTGAIDLPLSSRVSSWSEAIGFQHHIGLVLRVPESQVNDTLAMLPFVESLSPSLLQPQVSVRSTETVDPAVEQPRNTEESRSRLPSFPAPASRPQPRAAISDAESKKLDDTLHRLAKQREECITMNKDLQHDTFRLLFSSEGLMRNRCQLEEQLAEWQRQHQASTQETHVLEQQRELLERKIEEHEKEDQRLTLELRRHEALHIAACEQQRDEEAALVLLKNRLRDVRNTAQKDHTDKLARLAADHEGNLEQLLQRARKRKTEIEEQTQLVKENTQRSLATARNLQSEVERLQHSLDLAKKKILVLDTDTHKLEHEESKREDLLVKYRSTELVLPDLEMRIKQLRRQLEDTVDQRKQLALREHVVTQESMNLQRELKLWESRFVECSSQGAASSRAVLVAEEEAHRCAIAKDAAAETARIARTMFGSERFIDNRVSVAMRLSEKRCMETVRSLQMEEAAVSREVEQLERRAESLTAQLSVAVEEQASVLQAAREECDAALAQLEETRRGARQRLSVREVEGERKKTTCRTLFNEFLLQIKEELDAGVLFLKRKNVPAPPQSSKINRYTDGPRRPTDAAHSKESSSGPESDQQEADQMMRVVESYLQWSELMAQCNRIEEEVVRTRQATARCQFTSKQITELIAKERQKMASLENELGRAERLKREALDATKEFSFAAAEQRQAMHDAIANVLEEGKTSLEKLKEKSAAAQQRVAKLERSMLEERSRAANIAQKLSTVNDDQQLLERYQAEYDAVLAENIKMELQLETSRRMEKAPLSSALAKKGPTEQSFPEAFSPLLLRTPARTGVAEIASSHPTKDSLPLPVLPTPHFSAVPSLNNSTRDWRLVSAGEQDDNYSIPSPQLRLFSSLDKPLDSTSNGAALLIPPPLPSRAMSASR